MRWQPSIRLNLLFLGLTAILAGYFMVWLPGPSAGLQLIGIEVGEWIKFLGIGAGRNWFYLPPIVIGLTLALLAATWPNGRIQTWMARGLAVDPAARYTLDPEHGPRRVLSERDGARRETATGLALLALAEDVMPQREDLSSLRLPLRTVLLHTLGGRGLKSWEMLGALGRLGRVGPAAERGEKGPE